MKMVLQPGGLSLRVGVGAFGVGGYSTLFMYTAINTGIEISITVFVNDPVKSLKRYGLAGIENKQKKTDALFTWLK
jgi:hypothetical protein